MRTLALLILTMGMALAAGHARAQRYDPAFPVCLYVVPWGGGSYYNCSYYTMDQRRASSNAPYSGDAVPVLVRWSNGAGEMEQSALLWPSRIKIARAR